MNDIGDYYDRKDKERRAAHDKWMEAMKKYDADPTYANEIAKWDAYEDMIDAGNTGD